MNFRISGLLAIAGFALTSILGSAQSLAQNAYITNQGSNTVSVIDTRTNIVTATIAGFNGPDAVAVPPDGKRVYVTNINSNTVSVIDTAKNKVTATIPVDSEPNGVAVSPDGKKVYVTSGGRGFPSFPNLGTVSVIDTVTDKVTATISVGHFPTGLAVSPDGKTVYVADTSTTSPSLFAVLTVIDTSTNTVSSEVGIGGSFLVVGGPFPVAVSPDGSKVYVADMQSLQLGLTGVLWVVDTATPTNPTMIPLQILQGPHPIGSLITGGIAVSPNGNNVYVSTGNVWVIDAATNTVSATIPVGYAGAAVTPDGSKVYVANEDAPGTVSVIDAATNTVTATIPVGSTPVAFGVFIQPAGRFAGTPGHSNCHGQSVSALAQQFGGLNAAAAALGYSSVSALQDAILSFCEG